MPQHMWWFIGMVLYIPCYCIYFHYVWFPYLEWLGHIKLSDTATKWYMIGVALHLAVILPWKKVGRVLIAGFPTPILIGPGGIWPIPNIGHITITLFGWAPVRVVIDGEEDEDREASYVRIEHDSATSMHIMHSEVSLAVVTLFRSMGLVLGFIFGYKKGQAHETVSRFGFRVMLVAFVMAWIHNDPRTYVESVRPQFTIPFIEKVVEL